VSFAERVLNFKFYGSLSGDFSAAGLRAVVSINKTQGRLGVQATAKIWGLSLPQMNAYSSKIPTDLGVNQLGLVIEAGDLDGNFTEAVDANVWESYIDLTGTPDSAFVVVLAGIYTASNPMAAQSPPPGGTQDAATLIQSICASAGFTLINNGAHQPLLNQSTYGSALDQIERIAMAAGFAWAWSGKKFYIWPVDGEVDSTVVQIGPNTTPQMVGFPQYWPQGLIVQSLYNAEVQLGRKIEVVGSAITKANGPWQTVGVRHDLSTMLGKGPWFTTATLAAPA
jgi:hypothetical protein